MLETLSQHPANRVALTDGATSITYGALADAIAVKMQALQGVSVVALALDNSVDWVLWDLAALQAGIACVPLPPFFSDEQINHTLQTAGVSHSINAEGLRATSLLNKNALPTGTAKVTFTSGTTGTPKGVCLPRQAMENVATSIVDVLGADLTGHHACVLPLAVLLENVAGVYAGLLAGCTVHLTPLQSFGAQYAQLHTVLAETKASSVILVPELLRILMAQLMAKGALPQLKFVAVGGSKVDAALVLQARAMGLPVYEGYGLSECASVVCLNTPTHDKLGTVGKLLPHVQATIINHEICLKNTGFLGYVGEQAPASFATGDLGELDNNGFLSITGRRKNVLITSHGRNISPEWVEAVLLTQPAIAQVIVYGDAQPQLSALIVPSSPDADVNAAINTANQHLPDYARVYHTQIVPPFSLAEGTLTGTGRPRRAAILTRYKKDLSHDTLRAIA